MKKSRYRSGAAGRLPALRTSRSGVVLIVVLVLVMMVALAGFAFLRAMSTEYEAAKLQGDFVQARHVMASAEASLLWFAEQSPQSREAAGGWFDNSRLFRGRLIDVADSLDVSVDDLVDETEPDLRWRFSIVSPATDSSNGVPLRFGLQNESARVDLATLLAREQEFPGSGYSALMQLPGMTQEAADSILDWIDEDDTPRLAGAEAAYYRELPRPCRPRNDLPQSLEELLFVKGVTKRMLDGESPESFDMADPLLDIAADSGGDSGGDGQAGLRNYLTLHSAERNADRSARPKVNLNSEQLLQESDRLRAAPGEDVFRFIRLARQYGLAESGAQGVSVSSVTIDEQLPLTYPVHSLSDLIDAVVIIPGNDHPTTVNSPLRRNDPEFDRRFTELVEVTTTENAAVLNGRINILDAPEPVLRTLPGLSPETASQIVMRRSMLDENQRRGTTWLLTEGILDLSAFRTIFDDITTGGDVFSAEIIVFREVGGPVLRKNIVIDAANRPATVVIWTDLSEQGLPAPLAFLSSASGEFADDLRAPFLP